MDHKHPAVSYALIQSARGSDIYGIVLAYEDHVVVSVTYSDELADGELLAPLDVHGNGLARVPVGNVRGWLTDEEADLFQEMRRVDEQLLSYAR